MPPRSDVASTEQSLSKDSSRLISEADVKKRGLLVCPSESRRVGTLLSDQRGMRMHLFRLAIWQGAFTLWHCRTVLATQVISGKAYEWQRYVKEHPGGTVLSTYSGAE